ncbi:MAG: hypothetical protein QOH97_2245, partial [Actinoplanes sp.]|nr:hypothetical protein [Actinoplanes sp.]
ARWLRNVEPEMYHHQGRHYYWHQLAKFATYQPPADAPSGSPQWHRGQWVPRPTPPTMPRLGNSDRPRDGHPGTARAVRHG